MIVELKKRYGKGFRFNTSYTLAKAENGAGTGNGGGAGFEGPFSGARLYNQFDVESYRQLSPTDQCHRLVNSGIYTIESGRPISSTLSLPNLPFQTADGA